MGRIFDYWEFAYFVLLKKFRSIGIALNFGSVFHGESYVVILTKTTTGTFWAIFKLTHQVTLVKVHAVVIVHTYTYLCLSIFFKTWLLEKLPS
jgi:hypothetical protein